MTCDSAGRKTPPFERSAGNNELPQSGEGADSALAEMLKRRQMRVAPPDPMPTPGPLSLPDRLPKPKERKK